MNKHILNKEKQIYDSVAPKISDVGGQPSGIRPLPDSGTYSTEFIGAVRKAETGLAGQNVVWKKNVKSTSAATPVSDSFVQSLVVWWDTWKWHGVTRVFLLSASNSRTSKASYSIMAARYEHISSLLSHAHGENISSLSLSNIRCFIIRSRRWMRPTGSCKSARLDRLFAFSFAFQPLASCLIYARALPAHPYNA